MRQDKDVIGVGVEKGGRRDGEELRSASHAARDQLQKDKGGFERDGRRFTSIAAAEMPNLGSQTAREFHRGEDGLKAGLQGTAHAAETLLRHANMKTELESVDNNLIGDVHKAENAFSRTDLGQEVQRG